MARKKPGRKKEQAPKRGIAWPRWTGFRGMTVRDWLQLLIIPLALVVISFVFTMQQDARQQKIENQRAAAERELAEQRAQDEALQAYLSQMGSLILEKDLRESAEDSEVRALARARTLTVLSRLDATGKGAVIQFLQRISVWLTRTHDSHIPYRRRGFTQPLIHAWLVRGNISAIRCYTSQV
jgi:hypothetical protein